MAKASFIFKVTSITVLAFIANGVCFKINTTATLPSPTTTAFLNSNITAHQTQWHSIYRDKVQKIGQIIGKLVLFIYSCLAIALICDEYFVPTLELIGAAFSLPSDTTGAILIPIGTSGPEIFSSAVGVFFTQDDIGTGAIIGSAAFNLLAIPAGCGLAVAYFLSKPISLEPTSILRHLVFYIVSVIVLILIIKDNSVDLMDALLLVVLFALYVGIMICSAINSKAKIAENFAKEVNNNKLSKSESAPLFNKLSKSESTPLLRDKTYAIMSRSLDLHKSGKQTRDDYIKINETEEDNADVNENNDDDDFEESLFMKSCILGWLLFPMSLLFKMTMCTKCLLVTFLFSMGWLSVLSYFSVWSISGISEMLMIPQIISGMTILAAGSAVPDLITSVIVIRKYGFASMGICAALASNVYAIVVGLGLPWLFQCVINWIKTGEYNHSAVIIHSSSLTYSSILLLMAIISVLATFKFCKWNVYYQFSFICLMIHFIFLTASITIELFVNP